MAATSVLHGRPSGPVPGADRREAHLRTLQSSWAAANGLPNVQMNGSGTSSTGDSIPVWSSARQRDVLTPAGPRSDAFHAHGPRAVDTSVSLTRRGRFLLIGLPIALGVIALILLGAFLTSQAQAGETAPASTVTIEVSVVPGESLWGLALEHSPERDPRVVVAEMVELNNLHSSLVQAGQRILIPADR